MFYFIILYIVQMMRLIRKESIEIKKFQYIKRK